MALDVGICFHRDELPRTVVQRARGAEDAGFDEFWVIEDCFFTAGVTLAAAALTATSSLRVGIGIMPAVARNPAVSAMEIATLAELAPGRFHAGIGHGVQEWMAQMGELKASPVTMLEETLSAIRRLLAGERVTVDGRYVQLEDVALELAPTKVPLVSAGVRGPRSLEVAGRCADGTILADFCSPAYLQWARAKIAKGNPDLRNHRITVFCTAVVGADGDAMRDALSFYLAEVAEAAPTSLQHAPFFGDLVKMAGATGWLAALQSMPTDWWGEIAAVGTPADAAGYLRRLGDAGAHAVALFPDPADPEQDSSSLANQLLPLLR